MFLLSVISWTVALCLQGFSRQEYWIGYHALLQGIFPTQRLNSGLPHCMRILYHLSHQGSPRVLEWKGKPIASPGGLPDPGIEPGSPALQADSLPTELSGKPKYVFNRHMNDKGNQGLVTDLCFTSERNHFFISFHSYFLREGVYM